MIISQFRAGIDIFSDFRMIYQQRPINRFSLAQNRYRCSEVFCNSGGRMSISGLFSRRRYRYRETIKSYSNPIRLYDHIYFQWQRRKGTRYMIIWWCRNLIKITMYFLIVGYVDDAHQIIFKWHKIGIVMGYSAI